MVMVELPEGVARSDIQPLNVNGKETVYSYKHAVGVQNALFYDFKIEVCKCSVCSIIIIPIYTPPKNHNTLHVHVFSTAKKMNGNSSLSNI